MSETTTTTAVNLETKHNHNEINGDWHESNNVQLLETSGNEDLAEITAEDLAPDGGFGWIIGVAMVVVFVVTTASGSSFMIVFGEFLEATGQAGSVMTLLNSVFMISFSLSGLLTTALLKKYPMREVGIIASIIFTMPTLWTAFVTQVWHLVVVFFIQGIGLGLINNICNANFNAYWVKKRAKVMSAAHVIIGLGGIVYPIMIEKFMSHYGFRGTALLTAGLSLNCIVGMMLMHPVEWHMRDPDEVRKERAQMAEESRKLLSERLQEKPVATGKFVHPILANRRSTIHAAQVFAKPSRWSSLRSLKEGGPPEVPLLIETFRCRVASDVESVTRMRSGSGTNRTNIVKRKSGVSANSIGNIAGVGSTFAEVPSRVLKTRTTIEEVKETSETERVMNGSEKKTLGICSELSELFDLPLLKDRAFMTMTIGISFVFTSDFTFSSLLPLMMIEFGYTTRDAALTITVAAAAELVSRISLAVFTLFVNARPKVLIFLAMISMGFAKIAFLYFDNTLNGILVTVAAIGVVRSWLYVPQPLVVVENFPVERYAAAYGIFSLVSGMIMIIFGPVVGFIKDWTDSFAICQLILIAFNSIFFVPWTMEFLAERRRTKLMKKELKARTDVKQNVDFHTTC